MHTVFINAYIGQQNPDPGHKKKGTKQVGRPGGNVCLEMMMKSVRERESTHSKSWRERVQILGAATLMLKL